MSKSTTKITFYLFDFLFTPYKGEENIGSSCTILKGCLDRINEEKKNGGKAIVINRHEGRVDSEPRNMFVVSAAYLLKEKKYKCRIALIRDNKIPIILDKTNFSLTPFDQLGDQALVETTNFYIDLDGQVPVVCCEFNNNGPRISDIEFYFRHISNKMLRISKACKASIHMKMPVNEVLESITDVLQFSIKARPNRLSYLYQEVGDPFIANMNALANSVNPQSLRVKAFFRDRGTGSSNQKNNQALAFIKRALNAFKNDNEVIEDFDDFYLEFEKEDGSEEIFNLTKGKQEFIIDCSFKTPGNLDTKELFEKTNEEFESYLQSRNL
jgi:hypothetical protein